MSAPTGWGDLIGACRSQAPTLSCPPSRRVRATTNPARRDGATTMADEIVDVIGGVDTHGDVHVAAVVDDTGRILGTASFPTTPAGYRRLLSWMRQHGVVVRVGVEGTGSWGAGPGPLPDRRRRRGRRGRPPQPPAPPASRQVRSRSTPRPPPGPRSTARPTGTPKTRTGPVEAIRALRVARRSAMKARTQALAQTPRPDHHRPRRAAQPAPSAVHRRRGEPLAARYRPGDATTVVGATKLALRELALRVPSLEDQVDRLDATLAPLVTTTCPALVARFGVGHPDRRRPARRRRRQPRPAPPRGRLRRPLRRVPGGSLLRQVIRHRLNRGGDRQANHALWRIVFVRMRHDPRTRDYVERRTKEGRPRKRSCAASSATSPARSTTASSRPRPPAQPPPTSHPRQRPLGRHRRPPAIIGACGAR